MKQKERNQLAALQLRSKDLTIKQIAEKLNIDKSTIYHWIKTSPDFAEKWDVINEIAMNERVAAAENGLQELLTGKIVNLPDKVKTMTDETGRILTKTTIEGNAQYVAPNFAAIMMTLRNGNPKQWDVMADRRAQQADRHLDIEAARIDKAGDMVNALDQVLQEYSKEGETND